nr:hypothetical protein [Nitrosomonas ureae]
MTTLSNMDNLGNSPVSNTTSISDSVADCHTHNPLIYDSYRHLNKEELDEKNSPRIRKIIAKKCSCAIANERNAILSLEFLFSNSIPLICLKSKFAK